MDFSLYDLSGEAKWCLYKDAIGLYSWRCRSQNNLLPQLIWCCWLYEQYVYCMYTFTQLVWGKKPHCSLSRIDVHMYVDGDSSERGVVFDSLTLFIFFPWFSGWRRHFVMMSPHETSCSNMYNVINLVHISFALWHATWVGVIKCGISDDNWLTDIPELGS